MAGGKPGTCRFGAGRLQPRIRAFVREIDGVRAGTDPECVHRMRVASRRLRSALPLFGTCFPGRKYRRWLQEIKVITRALGTARDTDVQLAFLDAYEHDVPAASGHPGGIDRIRAVLQGNRRQEQEKILSALDTLDRGDVLREISTALRKITRGDTGRVSDKTFGKGVPQLAARRIRDALSALLSYDAAVHNPDDIEGHHAMRIAAKKLRYTMEVFRPLFPDRLKPALRSIKHLQELLGQLHDCDVWIRFLSEILPGKASPAGTPDTSGTDLALSPHEEAGITALLASRRAAREELYGQLVAGWETFHPDAFADCLRAADGALPAPEPVVLTPPPDPSPAPARLPANDRLGALAGLFPEGEGHARQVTRLALNLFDELAALHGYGKKERSLLGYAGLLHDIGWAHGQKGHHTRSCRMILADRTLPVTARERTMIALVARYHRKELPEPSDRTFTGLKPEDRQRVLALSALLRIVDGFDYTHTSRVASLACTLAPDAVTCVPVYDGDGAIERARALQKSDLFARVYQKRFEIP